MGGITLEIALKHLKIWLEADKALSTGESYKICERQLTRVDVDTVHKSIEYWDNKVNQILNEINSLMMFETEEDAKEESKTRITLTEEQANTYHIQIDFIEKVMEEIKKEMARSLRKRAESW